MKYFGFTIASLAFMALFAASATPIPLYEIYRQTEGLSYSDLSLTAVVYFAGAVTALLFFGRISNHLGRKPVTFLSFALAASACILLLDVDNAWPLIVGRLLLGIACGLASSTVTSYIVDLSPLPLRWLAAAILSCGAMLGLTVGALTAGTLVQYGPAPRTLCYLIILALLTVCSVLLLFAPETVKRQPGFLQSLIPHFSMPHSNRRLYPIAASIFVATWGLGGFYQAFGPSIASEQLGSHNTFTAALVFSAIMVPSAFGGPLNKFLHPVGAQRLGIVLFTISLGGIIIALKISSISLFLTTSVFAGFGQGITLTGSIRTLLEDIPSEERASILSLIYATSYTGAAVPSFIAGQLSHCMNLFEIALCYGLLAISACAITFIFTENKKVPNNAASYST